MSLQAQAMRSSLLKIDSLNAELGREKENSEICRKFLQLSAVPS